MDNEPAPDTRHARRTMAFAKAKRESSIPSTAGLSAACDIIRRLIAIVNYNNEYDEHECPNGEPPCACCKLVTKAKRFIADNAEHDTRHERSE